MPASAAAPAQAPTRAAAFFPPDELGMSMTAYGRPAALPPWMTKGHSQQGTVASYFDVAVLAGAVGSTPTSPIS